METTKELKDLLQQATDKWGEQSQLDMLGEESSEVIHALFKIKREGNFKSKYDNLHEEVADLILVLLGIEETVLDKELLKQKFDEKVIRLRHRLQHRDFQ